MGVRHSAFAALVLASLCIAARQAAAVEFGELQALPGSRPPYGFRLAIIPSPRGSSDVPVVRVRHPHDTLSFVKNNVLEFRLPSLTDVELEVHQGGQTFNRLLPKSELQAARARLETTTASIRHQPAPAKGLQSPAAEARSFTPAPEGAPDRALLEREMQEIRQEIQNLVGRVTPWEGLSTPARPADARDATPVFTLTLWGVCIAGAASLVTGYLMQRSIGDRQRRRFLDASIGRPRGALLSGGATLHPVPRARFAADQPGASAPVAVMRRVRVSRKTRRRIRVWTARDAHEATREGAARAQPVARSSHAKPSAPAEVVEALGNLRRELLSRRRLPDFTGPETPEGEPRRAAH